MQPKKGTQPPETTVEEVGLHQRSKKKLQNDTGNYGGETTSKVPREEPWMFDKTSFLGENGKRMTYADLVIHGTLQPEVLEDDDEDGSEELLKSEVKDTIPWREGDHGHDTKKVVEEENHNSNAEAKKEVAQLVQRMPEGGNVKDMGKSVNAHSHGFGP
ncbi:hypothetical protein PIB30_074334 [Stylosanthes scabra]|uniref:Uncharacterized protein n=1 Tax=Stylosanthes scabra TaxID=79078 RepID=A0ABU6YNL7_9FABA|nr:hypothetical protein [Stylosanthes scabra]